MRKYFPSVVAALLWLVAFCTAVDAQWAIKAVPVQAWNTGSLFEQSLIHQIRFPRGSAGTSTPLFNGSPAVTITNGTIAGSIVDSRMGDSSTFRTPFFVQVSASGISATGTSAPYEDLSYSWNFGEGCGDAFTRPTDGATVCSGIDQRGPEAAYVYRTAGTKIVTLTVTGSNGTCASTGICNTVTPYVVTKSWTVNAFPASNFYVSQINGNDSWDGSTPAFVSGSIGPKQSLTALNSALNSSTASNTAYHLEKGSHWSITQGILLFSNFNVSSIRIDDCLDHTCAASYGTGAAPIIEQTAYNGSLSPVSLVANSSSSFNDIVVSRIKGLNSGALDTSAGVIAINPTGTITNLYLDGCAWDMEVDGNSNAPSVLGLPTPPTNSHTYAATNFGLWNNTVSNPTTTTTVSLGISGSAQFWNFVVGGSITGAGEDPAKDHHIYPDIKQHALFQWITCGPTGSGTFKRSFCINGNWDGIFNDPTDHQISQYWAVVENSCQYTTYCLDLGNRLNNADPADSTVQFQYVVISANAYIGMAGAELIGNGLSLTFRDNRMWGGINGGNNNQGFYIPPTANQVASVAQNTHLASKSYRNNIYMPSAADGGCVFSFVTADPWTVPQYIAYNKIVDARTSGQLACVVWSDWLTAGSTINFNTYSSTTGGAPGDTTSWFDNSTAKTFAQWQAAGTSPNRWDANGTNLAGICPPGWTCPVTSWGQMN